MPRTTQLIQLRSLNRKIRRSKGRNPRVGPSRIIKVIIASPSFLKNKSNIIDRNPGRKIKKDPPTNPVTKA
jgi:hypothetical protein